MVSVFSYRHTNMLLRCDSHFVLETFPSASFFHSLSACLPYDVFLSRYLV